MSRLYKQVVGIVWTFVLIMCGGMVGGAYLNDRTIEENPVRSLARVTSVGMRTNVDFQDVHGTLQSPSGLLYPTELSEGQRVWVRYNASRPELVKVDGRDWTLSLIPAGSVLFTATILAGVFLGAGKLVALRKRNR